MTTTPQWPLYLGCPIWACDQWAGEVYPAKTPRKNWLGWYSATFNTVEGNSTFYALPDSATFERWGSESADGFRFSLKFPREISHDAMLIGCDRALRSFLSGLEILAQAEKLGPTFLQLGPNFAPDRFHDLEHFVRQLPSDFPWAVELRHHAWFDRGEQENRINVLLRELAIDKVLFDSRPLFQSPPDDAIETKSQQRKPRTPVRQTVTGKRPMLRIVGRNQGDLVDRFFAQWSPIVAGWLRDGLQPYLFVHSPDDALAPALSRRFADHLNLVLPANQQIRVPKPPSPPQQLSLLE
jgi:uncharacterized protein YecE (DUF72 family)